MVTELEGWVFGTLYSAMTATRSVSTEGLIKNDNVPPFQVLFVCAVGACIIVLMTVPFKKSLASDLKKAAVATFYPPAFDHKWVALIFSCCMGDVGYLFLFSAQKTVTSAECWTIGVVTVLLFTPVSVYILFGEKQPKVIILAAIFAATGGVLMVQPGFLFKNVDSHPMAQSGVIYSALAGCCGVLRSVSLQYIRGDMDTAVLTVAFHIVCPIVFTSILCFGIALSFLFPTLASAAFFWQNPFQLPLLSFCVLLSQPLLFLFCVWFKTGALVGLGANKYAIVMQLSIVDCAILQMLFLGESENLLGCGGIALTIVGSVVLPLTHLYQSKALEAYKNSKETKSQPPAIEIFEESVNDEENSVDEF